MVIDIYEGLEDLRKGQEKILNLLSTVQEKPDTEKLYDMADIARILNVSRRTIATWTKEGILEYIKVGNKLWVTEKQLNSFLEVNSSEIGNDLKIKKG